MTLFHKCAWLSLGYHFVVVVVVCDPVGDNEPVSSRLMMKGTEQKPNRMGVNKDIQRIYVEIAKHNKNKIVCFSFSLLLLLLYICMFLLMTCGGGHEQKVCLVSFFFFLPRQVQMCCTNTTYSCWSHKRTAVTRLYPSDDFRRRGFCHLPFVVKKKKKKPPHFFLSFFSFSSSVV